METFRSVVDALGAGLPVLLVQMVATLALLGAGIAIYVRITPFNEGQLVAQGNTAGGITTAGSMVALAVPLAATLASSHAVIDIVLWGVIALTLQLIAFALATLLIKDLKAHIEAGNVAAATTLVGVQLAVALVNAAAMAG
jgi:putative membrane protein